MMTTLVKRDFLSSCCARMMAAALWMLACAGIAHGSGVKGVVSKGVEPNVSYQFNDFDRINTFSGDLAVSVPLGPTYKTNGTLQYNFTLRYNADFWAMIQHYQIGTAPGEYGVKIIRNWYGRNVDEQFSYQLILFDLNAPDNDGTAGIEAFPTGNAGTGWTISFGEYGASPNPKFELHPGGGYTEPDGTSHYFTNGMHAQTNESLGGVAYTNDNSYLRMRVISGGANPEREVDTPDGIRRRYRCVASCDEWNPHWNLQWMADPYGNVLTFTRSPEIQPASGNWIWDIREGTVGEGEERASGYYDPAVDTILPVRSHRLTYSAHHGFQVRLDKAELAGPNGDLSMVYQLGYAPRSILRTNVTPPAPGIPLVYPYDANEDTITVEALTSVTLPAGGGQWKFDYFTGKESAYDNSNFGHTYCVASPCSNPANTFATNRVAGRIRKVQAPTGGGYQYDYGLRLFPKRPCNAQVVGAAGEYPGGNMVAISKRQQIGADDQPVSGATWLYAGNGYFRRFVDDDGDGVDDGQLPGGGTQLICRLPWEFMASVLDPNGLLTINYFDIRFNSDFFGAPFTEHTDAQDTVTRRLGNNVAQETRFLSSRVYEAQSPDFRSDLPNAVRRLSMRYRSPGETAPPATLLRSRYVKYEASAIYRTLEGEVEQYNLRLLSEHERFHDDVCTVQGQTGPCAVTFSASNQSFTEPSFVEKIYSGFDGLGHFRQTNVFGNLRAVSNPNGGASAWDHRVEYTSFHPTVTWAAGAPNPSGLPALSAPWILGTYQHTTVLEGQSIASALYHFDSKRGYLRAAQKIKQSVRAAGTPDPGQSAAGIIAAEGADDFLTLFSRRPGNDPRESILRTESYGGDGGGVTAWTISGDQRSVKDMTRAYANEVRVQYGQKVREEYLGCNNEPYVTTFEAGLLPDTGSPVADPWTAGLGVPHWTAGPNGIRTHYVHDNLGRVEKVTPPGGLTPEEYLYKVRTGVGQINEVTVKRDGGLKTVTTFDDFGRTLSVDYTLPAGTSTTGYTYTATGKTATQRLPQTQTGKTPGTVRYTYDVLDRPLSTRNADDTLTDVTYKGIRETLTKVYGLAVEPGSPNTAQLTKKLDSFGRLSEQNDLTVATAYQYDAQSNLTSLKLNDSQVRRFDYDGRGVVFSAQYPELKAVDGPQVLVRNSVDARGHLTEIRHVWSGGGGSSLDAWTLKLDYDKAERIRTVWRPAYGSTGSLTYKKFEYHPPADAAGKRNQIAKATRYNYLPDGLETIDIADSYTYSSCSGTNTVCTGLLTKQTMTASSRPSAGGTAQPFFTASVNYGYDPRGELSQIDYPAAVSDAPARSIQSQYTAGYLTRVFEGQKTLAEIGYAGNGMISRVQFSHGAVRTEITPDAKGLTRPESITWFRNGGSTTSGVYTFDGAGNISGIGLNEQYRYDRTMRLTKATLPSQQELYAYDVYGNMTAKGNWSYQIDAASNRLKTFNDGTGAKSVEYDEVGNIVSMPDLRQLNPPDPAARLKMRFDPLGALTQLDSTSSGATGLGRVYVYNSANERMAVIDYEPSSGRREQWSVRDLANRVLRDFERTYTAAGASQWKWLKDYVYRGTILSNTIVRKADGTPDVRDVQVDHLGSTRFVTNDLGAIVGSTTAGTRYLPYGDLAFNAPAERLGFTGHERDDDGTASAFGDLDYMHARYYSAALGRFLSPDPKTGATSRYAYAGNNPVNYLDPDGEDKTIWIVHMDTDLHAVNGFKLLNMLSSELKSSGYRIVEVNAFSAKAVERTIGWRASEGDIWVLESHAAPGDDIVANNHGVHEWISGHDLAMMTLNGHITGILIGCGTAQPAEDQYATEFARTLTELTSATIFAPDGLNASNTEQIAAILSVLLTGGSTQAAVDAANEQTISKWPWQIFWPDDYFGDWVAFVATENWIIEPNDPQYKEIPQVSIVRSTGKVESKTKDCGHCSTQ